jgi:hypothetical protein
MSSRNRLSRSARLKKYESAYDTCIKEINIRKKNSIKKVKYKSENKEKSTKKDKSLKKNEEKIIKRDREKPRYKNKEKPRERDRETPKEKINKRKINIYQKFVKEESKKKKYQGLTAKERMTEIGKVWKEKNKPK